MKLSVNLDGEILVPFQVYVDLAVQLSCHSIPQSVFTPICELNAINDWINLEFFGQSIALRAKFLLHKIRPMLNDGPLELHISVDNGFLSIDNIYALLFLAQELNNLKLKFFVPENFHKRVSDKLALLTPLENLKIEFADLEAVQETKTPIFLMEHRKKLLQHIGINLEDIHIPSKLKPTALIGYAWVSLKAGAYELGESVLQELINTIDPSTALYEQLFMQLQLIRFLSHQYQAVVAVEYPETFQHLSEDDKNSIYFIKAYSATLSRNLPVAQINFEKCAVNQHMELSDENSLYRLNLYALYLALSGKMDDAYQAEMRIKNHIVKNKFNAVGLKYVNFINIARLYKKFKQYEQALSYYELAYKEIGGGGYTISDRIYYNINMGSVYEAAGRAEVALLYWLKVAMLWLSWDEKYSLSWRPRILLTKETIADIIKPLPLAKVSEFLQNKINVLCKNAKLQFAAAPSYKFTLHNLSDNAFPHETCYVGHHMVLYGSSQGSLEKVYSTPDNSLALLISPIVKKMMHIKEHHNSIAIDVLHEHSFPASEAHCHSLAALGNTKESCFNGKYLSNNAGTDIKLKISLSSSISSMQRTAEGLHISYKRSFLNKLLRDPNEIDFISTLKKPMAISVGEITPIKDMLKKLFAKKVISIEY